MDHKMVCVKRTDKMLDISYRPKTTDEKVINEVLVRGVYERQPHFQILAGEKWLDLGANIGTFSLLCLARGGYVIAYEPEPDNFRLLRQNIRTNFAQSRLARLVREGVSTKRERTLLFLCKGDYNKYRHTLVPRRGRQSIRIRVDDIRNVLKKNTPVQGIKMDIEGAEIPILEHLSRNDYHDAGVQKLVFEYSFDVDRSIPRFLTIVNHLRTCFDNIHHRRIHEDEPEYRYWPAAIMVYCWNQ